MVIRELKQSDIDFVRDNSISGGFLGKQPQEIDFSYTLEHKGEILGIGGIRIIVPGTAWAWTNWTHNTGSHITAWDWKEWQVEGYKLMESRMEELCKENDVRRLQAYVEVNFPEAIRMVKHLGFEYESTMKDFLPTGDAYLYVKLLE